MATFECALGLMCLPVLSALAPAQRWIAPPERPEVADFTNAVTDGARESIVVLDRSGATWTWDGGTWQHVQTPTSPPARIATALAYDPLRQRVVLYGGRNSSFGSLDDTWEWDGVTWTNAAPPTSPSRRYSSTLAFDPVQNRVLLFGGRTSNGGFLNDTWSYDGMDWRQLSPAHAPQTSRGESTMCTDPSRGRTVLVHNGLTYEWDGADWIVTGQSPVPTSGGGQALAFDAVAQRVVLCRGSLTSEDRIDLFEYDTGVWRRRVAANGPRSRLNNVMAFDPVEEQLIINGGYSANTAHQDTWALTAGGWTAVEQGAAARVPGIGMAHDPVRDEIVVQHAINSAVSTSVLGTTWQRPYGAGQFVEPQEGPLVFSQALQQIVTQTRTGQTWSWTGTTWQRLAVLSAPPALEGTAMAHDDRRGLAILFGGHDTTRFFDETWEFDGLQWTQRLPTNRPLPRIDAAFGYDPRRGVAVLFGGDRLGPGVFDTTWEYDGLDWTQSQPLVRPTARRRASLVFDPALGEMVLAGGSDPTANDTWSYDGSTWRPLSAQQFGVESRACSDGRRVVLFDAASGELLRLSADAADGSVEVGPGCSGALGVPTLSVNRPPALGSSSVPLGLTHSQPNALCALWLATRTASVPHNGGCTVHLGSPSLHSWTVTTSGGKAVFVLSIPDVSALRGVDVFAQAIVAEPQGPLAGAAVLSRALRLHLGD